MNCRDFRRRYDETLDARGATPAPALPPECEAHAASCPSCRSASAGYLLLGQAFAALAPPPPASAESMAGLRALLIAVAPAPIPARARRRAAPVRLASAATILALAAIGCSAWRWRATEGPVSPAIVASAPSARPAPTRPLDAAFREATRATIDLARAASAPAARIGREALDLDLHASHPAAVSEATTAGVPSRTIEAVGERVQAGVRPISGSARHAFSFLLGPAEPPPAPPAGRDTL